MIVMTLNCHWLDSKPKKLAVCRLVEDQHIDVLFLQESMGDGVMFAGELESIMIGWTFLSLDARGKSRGLLLGWRSRMFHLVNAWVVGSGLCVSLFSIELNLDLCFANIYGPYVEREGFWTNLLEMDCLKCEKLIFGGDLNFTLGLYEIWGARARMDSLSDFFTKSLETFGLVDIAPTVMLPTWTNRRVGAESICKRLDRFLLSTNMLDLDFFYCQWVGCGGDSDHQPVFLQILNRGIQLRSPFKFNAHWLVNDDLVKLLKESWVVYFDNLHVTPASHFASNFKCVKDVSISWYVMKKEVEFKDLVEIEILLTVFSHKIGFGFSSEEDKASLIELESRKRKILLDREHEARQKSRAI